MRRVLAITTLLAGCEATKTQPEMLVNTVQPVCFFWCDTTIIDESGTVTIGKDDRLAGPS
jgi:hypothetical protein